MSQRTASTIDAQPEDRAVGARDYGADYETNVLHAHRGERLRHFLWHLAEMVAAMLAGMVIGVNGFLAIVGKSGSEARHLYPAGFLLVMALSMTIPMVAWMRFRRHSWRSSVEMTAAMVLPALLFLACVWADVFHDAPNGPYMAVSTTAMVGLMLYRWRVYSAHPVNLRRAGPERAPHQGR